MRLRTLATLALAAPLWACSGLSTNSDWDPGFDFSSASTYAWVDSDSQLDDITRNRIRAAVDAQMDSRGFRRVDSADDAALAMSYQVSTETRSSFTTMNTGWGGYSWGWGPSMRVSTSTTRENRWEEGSLVVAMFDTGTEQLVWWGSATAELNDNSDPQRRNERINSAVEQLMRTFPPSM